MRINMILTGENRNVVHSLQVSAYSKIMIFMNFKIFSQVLIYGTCEKHNIYGLLSLVVV